jgi:hypothetical protein
MKRVYLTAVGLPLAALTASSCVALDWSFEGTAASSGDSTTAPSTTGAGGGTSATTGTGGAMTVCSPGESMSCYTGPEGTEGIGACGSGKASCLDDGSGFGACMGEATPGLPDCTSSADNDCDGVADGASPACWSKLTGAHVWSKVFPAANDQFGTSVAVSSAGDVVIAGIFKDTVSFGGAALVSAGGEDIFVARFDADGKAKWSKRFGGPTDEGQRGVQVGMDGAGNVLVTGMYQTGTDFGNGPLVTTSTNDVFVLKLDPSGTPLWSKTFGSTSLSTEAMTVSASGNVAVTGYFEGTLGIPGMQGTSVGGNDIFVAELNPSGALLWVRAFGDVSADNGTGIAFTPAGNVFVTGSFSGTVNFGDGPLTSAGLGDIFVTKLDTSGNALWSKRFGDASYQGSVTLATDTAANVFLLGRLNGTMDFGAGPLTGANSKDIFVAKLDQNGAPSWSKSFSSSSTLTGASIAADGVGNVVLTGDFSGSVNLGTGLLTSQGGNDIFVAKLSASSKTLWSKSFGDAANQEGISVAVDGSLSSYVLSYGGGTIDFGGGPRVSGGGGDTFLAKLAP